MPEGQAPGSMETPRSAPVTLVHSALSAATLGPHPGQGSLSCSEHSGHHHNSQPTTSAPAATSLLPTLWTYPFTSWGHFLVKKRGGEPGRDSKVPLSSDSDVLPDSAALISWESWADDRVGERERNRNAKCWQPVKLMRTQVRALGEPSETPSVRSDVQQGATRWFEGSQLPLLAKLSTFSFWFFSWLRPCSCAKCAQRLCPESTIQGRS